MKDLVLMINGESVAQIKKGKLLIRENYFSHGMTEVNWFRFVKHLKAHEEVCSSTLNRKLKEEYNEILNEVMKH